MKIQTSLRLSILAAFFLLALPALAAGPPCKPCAGIYVDDPAVAVAALTEGLPVQGESRLYVSWPAALDGTADKTPFQTIAAAGGTPWVLATFKTPAPLLENLEAFEAEAKALAELMRGSGARAHVQIDWRPEAGEATPKELGFLFKRAAVAITGAAPDARVLLGPLGTKEGDLRALYAEEIAAYVDGLVFPPMGEEELKALLELTGEVDPGKPVSLGHLPWPADASASLARAAEAAAGGAAVAIFDFRGRPPADLLPLKIMARDFGGDISFDPYTKVKGAKRSWAFVRGEDLGLRVVVETPGITPDKPATVQIAFEDPQLRNPQRVDLVTGEIAAPAGTRRTATGLFVPFVAGGEASVLVVERADAEDLLNEGVSGVEEKVDIASEREMPVEEILRRLQAVEDDQARRLENYQATSTLHLRFRPGTGNLTVDVAFEGPFFFRRKQGFDWVWQNLYINGVRWKDKKLPEIPLIQPEKAATLPLEINFTKDYTYSLRGRETIEGRDCWVVDFEPVEIRPNLWQGTVWVDRAIYARVRTRALQVALEGEVISNEETMTFSPVDENGQPAPWATSSFFLPLRNVGQQILSVLNTPTQLERETTLTAIRLNTTDYEASRASALASDATMVRDTAGGMKYLVKNEQGERVVQEKQDTKKVFLLGGTFYDESLDYPLPLAGVNYLDLDFRGKGNQLNIFFAGVLLTANYAEPRLFGSKWDAGVNVFGFFLPTTDEIYRGGEDPVDAEQIDSSNARVAFFLGRPLGNFVKLDFNYIASFRKFEEADDTDPSFVLPEDTLTHTFQTELTYTRAGWRANAQASINQRSEWSFWGLPGNDEFDPEQEDYLRWKASLAKTWWFPKFMQFSAQVEYMGGQDLDRFSKFDFGVFGDSNVAGYPSGLVRAEEGWGAHLSYGVNVGDAFKLELEGDAVWATDEATGLESELLGGVGLEGSFIGPWSTLMNFELGQAVAGPSDGFSVRLVFLKLWS
jgi:hypothetical protein